MNSWFRVEIRSVFDRDWPNSLRRTCFFAVGFLPMPSGTREALYFLSCPISLCIVLHGILVIMPMHWQAEAFSIQLDVDFYTVSQKKQRHQTLGHNFTNNYLIFRIFSPTDSVVNLQQIPV